MTTAALALASGSPFLCTLEWGSPNRSAGPFPLLSPYCGAISTPGLDLVGAISAPSPTECVIAPQSSSPISLAANNSSLRPDSCDSQCLNTWGHLMESRISNTRWGWGGVRYCELTFPQTLTFKKIKKCLKKWGRCFHSPRWS